MIKRDHGSGVILGVLVSAPETLTGNSPRVSVVLLNKDEPELATSLDLLRSQCVALDAECIVIDASRGRCYHIGKERPWVRWIPFEAPFWRTSTIPHQRNVGVRAARSAVVAFCDAGGQPVENWLEKLTAPLLNCRYDLVCGPIESLTPGVYSIVQDASDGEEVELPATANYAFKVSVFEEIDGFDERLFYGSDIDFTWRVAATGHPCFCVPDAVMYMDWNSGSKTISHRRSWRYGRAWAQLMSLHPERRVRMLKERPECTVYSGILLPAPMALAGVFKRRNRFITIGWLAAPLDS